MDLIERDRACISHVYTRYDICVDKGSGSYLYDVSGKSYIDMVQGLGASILGHAHPRINGVVKQEIDKITHISGLYYSEVRVQLAERLCSLSGLDRVSFINSGSEACDAAIKYVRKYGNEKRDGKNKIIYLSHGFHGKTCGAISLAWEDRYKKGFDPLLQNSDCVEVNDVKSLKAKYDKDVIAVIFEPVQGSANKISTLEPDFINGLKELQNDGVLLIADEVQCGMGRTGKLLAHDHYDLQPDVITMAKGLGNGYPIGVTLIKEEYDVLEVSSHGSTFGGNSWVCKAALEVLDTIDSENLLENSRLMGDYLSKSLLEKDWVKKVYGLGLMRTAELSFDAGRFVEECKDNGLLLNKFPGRFIKFSPAINIDTETLDKALNIMEEVAKKCM